MEVTAEMVQEIYARIDFHNHGDDGLREGLAAVLALVERDQAGPCSVTLQLITSGGEPGGDLWCQLRHGHLGDHENGITRWKLATPPQ